MGWWLSRALDGVDCNAETVTGPDGCYELFHYTGNVSGGGSKNLHERSET